MAAKGGDLRFRTRRPAPTGAGHGGRRRMLSPYRVIDATDHRGQLAGMMLAQLGAEVVLAEPPGGQPGRAAGGGLTWWAYSRGKHSVVCASDDDVLDLVRTADVLVDNGQFDPAVVTAV